MKVASILLDSHNHGIQTSLTWAVTSSIPGTSSLTMARGWVLVAVAMASTSSNNNNSITVAVVANTLEEDTIIIKVRALQIAEDVMVAGVVAVAVAVDSVNSLTDLTTRSSQRAPST